MTSKLPTEDTAALRQAAHINREMARILPDAEAQILMIASMLLARRADDIDMETSLIDAGHIAVS